MVKIILILACTSCLRTTAYHCNTDADCVRNGGNGVCEPTGFCAFADTSCGSMLRYGDLSGGLANTCVDSTNMNPDAGMSPDARPDTGGTPGDMDGDGVPDGSDNCPTVPNPGQENEDGDAFGDVCDPCPPYTDNTDGDGDGVGDLCDPHPTTAGDKLFLFEGFHHGVPTGWDVGGTWTQMGDDIAVTAGQSAYLATTGPTTGKTTTTASVTITSVAGGLNLAGVLDQHTAGSASGVISAVFHAPVGTSPGLGVADVAAILMAQTTAYEMTNGATYVITMNRNATAYTCNANRSGTMANITGTFNRTGTQVGIYASSATVHYQWLMVVSSP